MLLNFMSASTCVDGANCGPAPKALEPFSGQFHPGHSSSFTALVCRVLNAIYRTESSVKIVRGDIFSYEHL